MDAPLQPTRPPELVKIESTMFQLVWELFDANRESVDKVREIFNEVVFKEKENLEVLSLLGKDHKKKIISLRNVYKTTDKQAFTQLFNEQLNSHKKQNEETDLIAKKMDNFFVEGAPKKEKERVTELPVHDVSKDEELARKLQAEWGGEVYDDAALAKKLHSQMNGSLYNREPLSQGEIQSRYREHGEMGHPEMFYPQVRRSTARSHLVDQPIKSNDPWDLVDGIQHIQLDSVQGENKVIRQTDAEYIWLQKSDQVYLESGISNKRIYCAHGNKISIGDGCKNITIHQPSRAEIVILGSQVVIERAGESVFTISRGSKVNFFNCENNNINIAKDCVMSVYPNLLNHVVIVDVK